MTNKERIKNILRDEDLTTDQMIRLSTLLTSDMCETVDLDMILGTFGIQEHNNHTDFYTKAADELEKLLIENNIIFERESFKGGWAFRFPTLKMNNDEPDVVIHNYSYGHEDGLFESYQFLLDHGDVSGWLTPKEVLHHVLFNYNYLNTFNDLNCHATIVSKTLDKIKRDGMDFEDFDILRTCSVILKKRVNTMIELMDELGEDTEKEKFSQAKEIIDKLDKLVNSNK